MNELRSHSIYSTLYSQVFLKYFQVTELVQLLEDQRRKAVIMQRCEFIRVMNIDVMTAFESSFDGQIDFMLGDAGSEVSGMPFSYTRIGSHS